MEGSYDLIRVIKREANRIRLRTNYLKHVARQLANEELQTAIDDQIEIGYTLHSINSLIDSNVVYLTQLGERLTDIEQIYQDILLLEVVEKKEELAKSLLTELYATVAEAAEQCDEMTETVQSAREILTYFQEEAKL